jgi:diguanylate cyclase (GGDEF)-like protein/PAS domain S-box-containing protein
MFMPFSHSENTMEKAAFHSDLMSDLKLNATPELASVEVSKLSDMVEQLDDGSSAPAVNAKAPTNVASKLFRGLRAKHAPTAEHGLRVALGCSVWANACNNPESFCNDLEVSALLHDIGKIGVPDAILAKPSQLTDVEVQMMARHRRNGLEILAKCGFAGQILINVTYSSAWFDGSRGGFKINGKEIPLGARMLAIVDAFDSMTTDQVYRRAMSVERAIAELFQCSGSQFDGELVASFCSLVASNWTSLRQRAGQRWIAQMDGMTSNNVDPTDAANVQACGVSNGETTNDLFYRALVENMAVGAFFVGARQRITLWNRSMERMTGISSSSVCDKQWLPSLVEMKYEGGRELMLDEDCPIKQVFGNGHQLAKRVSILGRGKKYFTADLQVVPVIDSGGRVLGTTVTVHDVSSKLSLEERVETLYTRVTQDPLTKVANRAEFDRVHSEFVDKHMQDGLPCSLIICDLDFFKKINDDYGHQAGDHALVNFASLLKRYQHIGDLVARYGGEEFVLLCADCDNASATARAEEIRKVLQSTPQTVLDNKCLTSSFGVTEIQPGDTPETMLRRSDRALLMAKERGRNQVVQLGAGSHTSTAGEEVTDKRGFFGRFKTPSKSRVSERTLITFVPIDMAIEKLKGFVSDQFAQIVSVENNVIQMRADGHSSAPMRRRSDRPIPFMISMNFSKMEAFDVDENSRRATTRTKIEIIIEPIRNRDRRRGDLTDRANQIVRSLKSYLMASDEVEPPPIARAATESGRD